MLSPTWKERKNKKAVIGICAATLEIEVIFTDYRNENKHTVFVKESYFCIERCLLRLIPGK